MLVCFLKTESNVKASVIKFEDRIWISDKGGADVSRRFWIKVDRDSLPLSMLRCFLSRKPVQDVESLSEFSNLPTYPFNNRNRFSGIVNIVKGKDINTIDGIRYRTCKLKTENINLTEVGEGVGLDINLSEAPLAPDYVHLIAIKFAVENLIDLKPVKTVGETYFDFDYFSHSTVPDMYACIEEDMVVPVVALLPSDEGGFTVFLYSPPGYQLIPSDKDVVEKHCAFDYRGNSIIPVSGFLWEMSDFMKRKSVNPLSEHACFANNRFSFGLTVAGKMVERIYPREVRSELDRLWHAVTHPNKFTWLAIGLAAAGLIVGICAIIF